MTTSPTDDWAVAGGRLHTGLEDLSDDPRVLDTGGRWIVVQTYEGRLVCARFAHVEPYAEEPPPWSPIRGPWTSSLDRDAYVGAVETVRERIARGDVYQVNVCRVLAAEADEIPDLHALGGALGRGNPAPYAATVNLPSAAVYVVSASPELFLRRDGDAECSTHGSSAHGVHPLRDRNSRLPAGRIRRPRARSARLVPRRGARRRSRGSAVRRGSST